MNDPLVDAILPPTSLAVLAFLLVLTRRRGAAAVALLGLVLLSVEGVAHLLTMPLLLPASGPERPPGAVVVLSSATPDTLDPSHTVPSLETLRSLRTAAALSRQVGRPILVSGARAADGDTPVGTGMANSLETDFLVQAAWVETGSTNVWQSARAAAAILGHSGIDDIYLVGQPWELRLSTAVFRSAGLTVTPAATPHPGRRPLGSTALVAITPVWADSAVAIRQWLGLACQASPLCVAWMLGPTPGPN